MSTTPVLSIVELAASQSQPEIPVNTAIRILEAFADRRVVSRSTTVTPVSPNDGDVYVLPTNPSGTWAGKSFYIAINVQGTWFYIPPRAGWVFYVIDEDLQIKYSAGSPSGWDVFT